jgi:uncharacterized membrane protein
MREAVGLFRLIGWDILWILLSMVSIEFLLAIHGKYKSLDSGAYAMFMSRRGWLWTHLGAGALMIVLGPMQFLTRWPRAYPQLHRWAGRTYLIAMLVASTGAIGLIATSPAPFEIRAAFAATALAWLLTALIALRAIHRGSVPQHRAWMARNYLLTLSPVSFRLALPACIAIGLVPSPTLISSLLVTSWLFPLMLYEGCCRINTQLRSLRQLH